jgi:hypothetical protein
MRATGPCCVAAPVNPAARKIYRLSEIRFRRMGALAMTVEGVLAALRSRAPDATQRPLGDAKHRPAGRCAAEPGPISPCHTGASLGPGSAQQRFALQLVRDIRGRSASFEGRRGYEAICRLCRNHSRGNCVRLSPGLPSARGRDAPRSWGGRGCARNWCTAVRSHRARPERDTAGT